MRREANLPAAILFAMVLLGGFLPLAFLPGRAKS